MSEESKSKRTRSPAYPAIDLEEAIAKAATLWQKLTRHPASIETVGGLWGYDKNSSAGASVVAAMLKYGLLSDEGENDKREVKLTEDAIRLTYNPDKDSKEYRQTLKRAALAPKIHAELWNKYGGAIPDDSVVKRYLVVDRVFNEKYVGDFIAQFKRTIKFANLAPDDKVLVSETEDEESESMNAIKHEKPVEKPGDLPPPPAVGLGDMFAKFMAEHNLTPTNAPAIFSDLIKPVELARYTVPLGDNEAVITFTGQVLTPADFDALGEFVELFKKQFERKLKNQTKPNPSTEDILKELAAKKVSEIKADEAMRVEPRSSQ